MAPSLPAIIREVVVEAEYSGAVYEQSVEVEPVVAGENDTRHTLFLGSEALSKNDVGRRVDLEVSILPKGNPRTLDEPSRGIFPADSPSSIWSYDFAGEIQAVDVEDTWFTPRKNRLLLLDVAVGSVLVQPYNQIESMVEDGTLQSGTHVEVTATRTEIVGIRE